MCQPDPEPEECRVRVGLVGGIFHRTDSYRESVSPTTETVLASGLAAAGHEVSTYSPREIRRFLRECRDLDVVHLHHPGRLTTISSILDLPCATIYTPHRTTLRPDKISLAIGHDRMRTKSADALVALSPDEQRMMIRASNLPPERVFLIPNGLVADPGPALLRTAPVGGAPWRILFVGQLIPLKRPELLMEAASALSVDHKIEVRFVYQNDQLEATLRNLAAANSHRFTSVFRGKLNSSELQAEYAGAHIFALPSSTEALPSVITEAMYSGLPIVANDVGGIRWQMAGRGICTGIDSKASLDIAIRAVIEKYDSHARDAITGAEEAGKRFSVDTMVAEHVRMYKEVISRGRAE